MRTQGESDDAWLVLRSDWGMHIRHFFLFLSWGIPINKEMSTTFSAKSPK
jgi:hypothetical protein